MKIIVTTGYSEPGLDLAHLALLTAGLQEAGVSRRQNLTVYEIQKKIFNACDKDSGGLYSGSQLSPGRIWNDLAADFLTCNSDYNYWGWADVRTVRLLDFWNKIEDEIGFVLIYSSPEFAVAQALKNQPPTQETIQNIIAAWEACNTEMLRFYHRHMDQCMLVNLLSIRHTPEQYVKEVAKYFQIHLKWIPSDAPKEQMEVSALSTILSSTLIEDFQSVIALYRELESSANISASASSSVIESAEKYLAWYEYNSLLSELERTNASKGELSQALTENQKFIEQLTRSSKELAKQSHELKAHLEVTAGEKVKLIESRDKEAKLAADRQNKLEQLTAKFDEVCTSLNKKQSEIATQQGKANELKRENELLLLKLHQVQEELENYFLKCQDLKAHLEVTTGEKGKLIESLDQQAKLAADWKIKLELLTAKFDEVRTALNTKQTEIATQQGKANELKQENELLLLQLRQVQDELERYFLKYQELNGIVQLESGNLAFLTQFWHEQHPSEIHIDMRREISGENWYYAEHDGRWAGPANISTLKVPALRDGRYNIILDIADAIDPCIMTAMELMVNGVQVPLKLQEYYGGPEFFEAEFSTSEIKKASIWEIQFNFPKLMSLTQQDSGDHRLLAIRLKSLSLSLL